MQFERQARRAHQVNLTPLIDVVFLLIVFFMLSTSFVMSESIELSLPSDGQPVTQGNTTAALHVLVQADGTAEINGQRYDANAMDRRVREELRADPKRHFLLLSTNDATVQQLVTMMDLIYVNGGKNVQIDHLFTGEAPSIGGDVKLAE